MKPCPKCGEVKPLEDYHRNRRTYDGRKSQCKTCVLARETVRRTRPEVKARSVENKAEYYAANRERLLAVIAEYQSRPEVKARIADYRAANPHLWWEYMYLQRMEKYGFTPIVESFTRDELIARWGDACWHCKGEWSELDHHPLPVAHGGAHTLENTKPSCVPCNRPGGIRRLNRNDIGETA